MDVFLGKFTRKTQICAREALCAFVQIFSPKLVFPLLNSDLHPKLDIPPLRERNIPNFRFVISINNENSMKPETAPIERAHKGLYFCASPDQRKIWKPCERRRRERKKMDVFLGNFTRKTQICAREALCAFVQIFSPKLVFPLLNSDLHPKLDIPPLRERNIPNFRFVISINNENSMKPETAPIERAHKGLYFCASPDQR